ncbi:MAG: hypothetical protein NC097_00900 [Clostridium sp.]|nr:hypothetical protein [Prevotella sp.]MCM1428338.1 hypothetical protein [Clostridium sp.]MCM1474810.1 hypothetical protein [Muribaculaceae bacterium]
MLAVSPNVTKINYQIQKAGIKGSYSVSYNKDDLLKDLTTTNSRTFGAFYANNYVISYPNSSYVDMQVYSGQKLLASYNNHIEGLRKMKQLYTIEGIGRELCEYDNESCKVRVPVKDAVYPEVINATYKFKDFSVREILLKIRNYEVKIKIRYTGIPYNNLSYGFDVMSFILSEFLGVKGGCFDNWECLGMCYMDKFPAEVEYSGNKYVFDYAGTNHIEVKYFINNKLQDRFIFDLIR